jgi:glycerol uptake facilitator-like aquaporin
MMRAGTASRAIIAEFIGTAALLAIVVGSGIMGERLMQGNTAVALLANAGATAGGLYVLIVAFGPLSGAHFNPAVSAVMRLRGERLPAPLFAYIATQVIAAIVGVAIAHAMFDEALWQPGDHMRTGRRRYRPWSLRIFSRRTGSPPARPSPIQP